MADIIIIRITCMLPGSTWFSEINNSGVARNKSGQFLLQGIARKIIVILFPLPAVKEAIGKGKAFITGFEQSYQTKPIGGVGLNSEK